MGLVFIIMEVIETGKLELFLLAVGLSMDAFAVSVCKGLAATRYRLRDSLICGVWFGAFQALMPAAGYLVGGRFQSMITSIDHWIAFVLLVILGGNMIWESRCPDEDARGADLGIKTMFVLAVATSIDAMAVGVTFAFLDVRIIPAVSVIGATTFLLSAVGVKLGRLFGGKLQQRAKIFGGLVLILIGVKILIEHLFFGG